ncbi:MAG TPA: glycosyltransferase family 2 protein, partial [Longimicrobiaceae bacterium]|nr:glycosyltransferase family 2 protein [Longimicrobiaceae bacterium]
MSARISACIVCRDEADRLGPCLDSVAWADEVVVMDLRSSDGSAELAERHGARVVRRDPVPIVEWVRDEVASHATGDWVLVVDPDERVTPGLAAELRRLAALDAIDAVVLPRMNHDFGHAPSNPRERWEPQLRMYRRERVRWPEVPNALPAVPEERLARVAPRDELVLVHDRSRTVPEVLDRAVRYAPIQAQAMLDRGQVFTARAMLADLGRRTYRQLVQGRAWRDGVPGLLRVGVLVGFHFYVWAALWQLSGARRNPEDDRTVRRLGMALAPLRGALVVVDQGRGGSAAPVVEPLR